MGGSSSSSEATTQQTDNRRVLGEGAISAENSTVQILDGGAIKNAFDFAGTTVAQSYDFASKSNEQALDSLEVTSNLVKDAYADAKGRGALTDQILIGAIAMAGLVAFTAVKK